MQRVYFEEFYEKERNIFIQDIFCGLETLFIHRMLFCTPMEPYPKKERI